MDNLLLISLILVFALLLTAAAYFQAACKLSRAENWLPDFADLQDWRKNAALTKRLIRAIAGRERVQYPHLLRVLRRQFSWLLMAASATLVWIIGLFIVYFKNT